MSLRYQSSSGTMESNYTVEPQRRHTQLLMEFNQEMFKRNVLTDVECVVEGKTFQTHRNLLVCFSSYLKKKLLDVDGKPIAKKIYIPRIGSNEFEILLRYMYSGRIEVDCNNFYDVYKAASILEMQDAKAECLKLIDGKDEIRTYFYSYVLSKKLGVEQNWQKALKLITHRFEEMVFTKEFMQLDLQYVLEILSAQSIGARSEIIVFLAALNWLNHDYASRGVNAVSVMDCVRFSCMSMEEIVACYHPPFLSQVVQIKEVLMMLYRATCYIAAKSQGKESWFKKYANPNRNLVLESLPMELWHQESYRSVSDVQIGSQRRKSEMSPDYRRASVFPDSLKSHLQPMFQSEEPESKHLAHLVKTKCDPFYADKEDSNISQEGLFSEHQTLEDELKDRELSKKSFSLDRPRADFPQKSGTGFIGSLSRKEEKIPVISRRKDYDASKVSSTISKSIEEVPREIRYLIPENIKVIHLIKGPLNSMEEKSDAKHKHSKDSFKEFPEKSMPFEETSFKKHRNDKSADFEDYFLPTNYHSEDGLEKDLVTRDLEPRKNQPTDSILYSDKDIKENGCILVIGGMHPTHLQKDSGISVLIYNVIANKWMHYLDLPEPRHNHCSVYLQNILYVVGGCDSRETHEQGLYVPKRSCFKLNLENSVWSTMPDMKCARFDHAMITYEGRLIVIGGQDETGRLLKSVEMYYPKQSLWKILSFSLCCGRKGMGVAVYNGCIWIAGGFIQSTQNSQLEVISCIDYYHLEEKKWYFNSYSLPSPRCYCSLVEWDGKLYCIGGLVQVADEKRATNEVCFVDGENQLWKQGPYLPEPRMGGVAVTYGKNLYYLGGFNPENNGDIPSVFSLMPGAASWCIGPRMRSDIFGLSAVSYRIPQD